MGPPVVLAAPYAWPGEAAAEGYGRTFNPTWSALEAALGALEGGETLVFASGMAAIDAVLRSVDGPVLGPSDGYHRIPGARFVESDTAAYLSALNEGGLVWIETPVNPLLSVVDIAAVCEAAHAVGALVAVDNTVATPLGQTPLALGADFSVCAGTKGLSGHSDVLYGSVACATAALKEGVEGVRRHGGGILGPFEAYLAYRSLATLELRIARSSETALAVAQALTVPVFHPYFGDVAPGQMRHFGPLVSFDLGTQEAAERFLSRCELVEEATSFGGVHSTAERRARWGTDDVSPGLIRLSAGIEDTEDVVADVLRALGRS